LVHASISTPPAEKHQYKNTIERLDLKTIEESLKANKVMLASANFLFFNLLPD
jgi:hypothetical protein